MLGSLESEYTNRYALFPVMGRGHILCVGAKIAIMLRKTVFRSIIYIQTATEEANYKLIAIMRSRILKQ